jgi:hypothetical protein
MKQLRIILMALFALFAFGAFAASMANAEEGVLKASGAAGLVDSLIEGGASTFTTAAGPAIECKTLDDSLIVPSSDSHGTATLHWLSCTAGGLSFNSVGDKSGGGEVLVPVEILICLLASGQYAAAVTPPATVKLEVPALGLTMEIKGTIIGEIKQTTLGEKGKHFTVIFTGAKGKQTVATECKDEKGGVKKFSLEGSVDKAAFSPASEEVLNGLILFLEEVIFMNK